MFEEIKQTLEDFRVAFDVWFHENDLYECGATDRALARLRELGNIYEKDGAVWLATEKFGDDKDRVIIKSDGHGAYISGDAAYYLDKRERGFDRCIILLGADHHGYVGRLMAMCAAFGDEPGKNLEIIIGQMVNLLSHGTVVRMGKRSGNIVTLLDLVDEIGVDAARYALVRNSLETNLDIDIDLWTKATSDNPVFYVQYAHARVSSILRNAADLGLAPESHPELLTHEKEGDLLRALAEFPRVVQAAADLREPHRIARYLEDTAADYHRFYDNCRVLPMGDEEATDLNRARLLLVDATRTVLANGLGTARRQRPGADVTRDDPRGRLGARAGRPPRAVVAPRAQRRERPRQPPLVADRAQGGRRASVGGVRLTDLVAEHGSPAYVLDEADFRARARAFKRGVRGVRRLLRRQGVPLHRHRHVGGGGGAEPRRLHRRRAGGRRAGRHRHGQGRVPRQQQERAPSSSARSRSASAGSSSTRSTRSSGWPRSPSGSGAPPACWCG